MPPEVQLVVNGRALRVPAGTSVAAALMRSGEWGFHRSSKGSLRGPLCAMGTCFECRVVIDGALHCRSCRVACRDGMVVETDAGRSE